MNSQGLSPKIRKLYYDIEDGCNILYVMDKVKPGCVDHKRINKPPYKALAALPKKIENCNYAIDLGKKLNFSLVGVAGNDILDHNPTLTLALLWQMMRAYTVKVCTFRHSFSQPPIEPGRASLREKLGSPVRVSADTGQDV